MQTSFKVGQVVKIQKQGKKAHPIITKTITSISEIGRVKFQGIETEYLVLTYGDETVFSAFKGNHFFRIK